MAVLWSFVQIASYQKPLFSKTLYLLCIFAGTKLIFNPLKKNLGLLPHPRLKLALISESGNTILRLVLPQLGVQNCQVKYHIRLEKDVITKKIRLWSSRL
jgi:hypothetical protein